MPSNSEKDKKPYRVSNGLGGYRFFNAEGDLTQTLTSEIDNQSKNLLNLLLWLDPKEPFNCCDVIISIGTCSSGVTTTWQENLRFPQSKNTNFLILNLDSFYEHSKTQIDTDTKKHIPLKVDASILEVVEPLLLNILKNPNNNLIISDFRAGTVQRDIYSLLSNLLDYYRDPASSVGNLIFLHGYFSFEPVMWLSKQSIIAENIRIKATPVGTTIEGECADVVNKFADDGRDSLINTVKKNDTGSIYFLAETPADVFPLNPLIAYFAELKIADTTENNDARLKPKI